MAKNDNLEQKKPAFTLTKEQIDKIMPEVVRTCKFLYENKGYEINFNSSVFNFEEKIVGVVEKFENEGLILEDYVKAAVKQPQLFMLSPDKVEKISE